MAGSGLLPSGEAFGGLSWSMVAFFLGGIGCLSGGLLLLRLRLQTSVSQDDERTTRRLSGLAMANAEKITVLSRTKPAKTVCGFIWITPASVLVESRLDSQY